MGRTALWTAISDSLTADIAGGRYRAGDKLPTEAELATRGMISEMPPEIYTDPDFKPPQVPD